MNLCIQCDTPLLQRNRKYCSNKCQADYAYTQYVAAWKRGEADGNRGVHARNFSGHLRRYLFDKYPHACSLCGWNKVNEVTGKIPLEIDHIDGNLDNNCEENLRLICPNCHSLTSNFRNLNRGGGRVWRRLKYNRG